MEQEEHEEKHHSSKWKVNVKAPSPGDIRGEAAANQWTDNGGDSINRTQQALVLGSLRKGNGIDNKDKLRVPYCKQLIYTRMLRGEDRDIQCLPGRQRPLDRQSPYQC